MDSKLDQKFLTSIVIPFHNERESLKELLPALQKKIDRFDHPFEVLMVNDCSTDGSDQTVEKFRLLDSRFCLVSLNSRGGQTGAFQKAFSVARGTYIVRMDADLQDNPEDLGLFLEKIEEGYDIVLGHRVRREHPTVLKLVTWVYDKIIRTLFHSELQSNSGSFLAFRACYLKNIPFRKNDHRYLPLIAMRRGAKKIGHIDADHRKRRFGRSNYNLYRKLLLGGPELVFFLLRYYWGVYDLIVRPELGKNHRSP